MKLWLIIVVWNTVGGVIGPLPYDEAECTDKANEAIEKFEAVPENRLGFKFICERRNDKVELGDVYVSYPTK